MPAKKSTSKKALNLSIETPSQRILLEEFRLLEERFLAARNEGVTRLNFFVTSASVALGGVLVFGSGDVPSLYFRIILLVTLTLLSVVGLEIYNSLIYRDTITDRFERGLAQIRNYFTRLDPELEKHFVSRYVEVPTGYVITKNSGIRRSMQIIESFLLGLVSAVLSTFIYLGGSINVLVGIIAMVVFLLLLEMNARRRLNKALSIAENEIASRKLN